MNHRPFPGGGWLAALSLFCALVAPGVAADSLAVPLTYEQTEDRSNFIARMRKARGGDVEAQWEVAATYARLGDLQRAIPLLRSAAVAGDARAAILLASLHEEGRGVEQSIVEAKHWYLFAAEKGRSDAMGAYGRLLLREDGAEARDLAWRWLRDAAQQGDRDGQYYLAWLLVRPKQSSRGDVDAYRLFLDAARQGHVGAQVAVASHLMTGRGVEKNTAIARSWLEKAVGNGDPVAHYLLARLLDEAGGEASRVRSLYRVAAAAGHLEAYFVFGVLLAKSAAEEDKREARVWLEKARRVGHKLAANRLGEMYRDGTGGRQQPEAARKLFQHAAEQGSADAMYNLAEMQNLGQGGPQDTVSALNWYTRAADAGHEAASEIMGRLLNSPVKTAELGLRGFWQ